MNYKILSETGARRRWIKLGTLTRRIEDEYLDKPSCGQSKASLHYLITALDALAPNIEQGRELISFVSLDSAFFLGKSYESLTNAVNSHCFSSVYIVGDLGVSNNPIPHIPKAKLLYSQEYSQNGEKLYASLHAHDLWEGIVHGIYPGVLYGCKDLVMHPLRVAKLLSSESKLILFAGQDGTYSIQNLFMQHDDNALSNAAMWRANVNGILKRLSGEMEIQPSVVGAAELIVAGTSELTELIENTKYAIEQGYLKEQRCTVLFKSVFRFVFLRLLVRMNLLTIIAYPTEYIRIYNSNLYNRHLFLDLGGINGYEPIYPRVADMVYSGLVYFQVNQQGMQSCQQNLSIDQVARFIDCNVTQLRARLAG